ncbi:MAG: hypothetical protein ACOH5I_15370 [Oligoflexus sp.]
MENYKLLEAFFMFSSNIDDEAASRLIFSLAKVMTFAHILLLLFPRKSLPEVKNIFTQGQPQPPAYISIIVHTGGSASKLTIELNISLSDY